MLTQNKWISRVFCDYYEHGKEKDKIVYCRVKIVNF